MEHHDRLVLGHLVFAQGGGAEAHGAVVVQFGPAAVDLGHLAAFAGDGAGDLEAIAADLFDGRVDRGDVLRIVVHWQFFLLIGLVAARTFVCDSAVTGEEFIRTVYKVNRG